MIERYSHEKHFFLVRKWLEAYGLKAPDQRLFSPFGLVVEDCAVGFLFKTDGGTCYIDHVAADPVVDKNARDEALNVVLLMLEKEAKDSGFLLVTALAGLPAMRKRFERASYSKYGEFGLYYKVLKGE